MMNPDADAEWLDAVAMVHKGYDDVIALRPDTILAVETERHNLADLLAEKWAKVCLAVGLPTLVVGMILGWCVCQLKHLDIHPAEPAVIRRIGEP